MKIGCCIDLDQVRQTIEAGYDFVDLNGQELASQPMQKIKEAARIIQNEASRCSGYHATVPAEVRLAGNGFRTDRVREYFHRLADRSCELNPAYIGIGSPASRKLTEGFDRNRANDQLCEALKIAEEYFPNSVILLEALNAGETNYINSFAEACSLVKMIASPRIRIVLDLYHFSVSGEIIDRYGSDDWDLVEYLHIADPNQRAFPSSGTSKEFVAQAKRILQCVDCKAIAIEAQTNDFYRDAKEGLEILKRKIMEA